MSQDGAWSPDGTEVAYTTPAGDLTIESLGAGTRRIVATHVTALDW